MVSCFDSLVFRNRRYPRLSGSHQCRIVNSEVGCDGFFEVLYETGDIGFSCRWREVELRPSDCEVGSALDWFSQSG